MRRWELFTDVEFEALHALMYDANWDYDDTPFWEEAVVEKRLRDEFAARTAEQNAIRRAMSNEAARQAMLDDVAATNAAPVPDTDYWRPDWNWIGNVGGTRNQPAGAYR